MGDGHHGWAAAEIILFLRSCMVKEENGVISLFKGNINRLVQKGKNVKLKNVPTTFGEISCSLVVHRGNQRRYTLRRKFQR